MGWYKVLSAGLRLVVDAKTIHYRPGSVVKMDDSDAAGAYVNLVEPTDAPRDEVDPTPLEVEDGEAAEEEETHEEVTSKKAFLKWR